MQLNHIAKLKNRKLLITENGVAFGDVAVVGI